ncbi:striatin, putative [Schistosoma mansoni]|uniref:striatin, putative n=1 Tax=Schistosoma mansoni TaxID=6183 RepID=UPI00022C812D|nr:striatin, putative [Schistosoma mansoni]|eukprot:XP_018645188.1 striatin, putative [Schistosoma mansoni]
MLHTIPFKEYYISCKLNGIVWKCNAPNGKSSELNCKFLQEVGYADAVLSVREARVRHLLLSAAGWPNEPDSSLTTADPKNKHYHWECDKPKSKLNDNAGYDASLQDELAEDAIAKINQVVRSGSDFLTSDDLGSGFGSELSDQSTEPDTTGNSGTDNSESFDNASWVNRFRRTSDANKRKSQGQTNYLQRNEYSKNITSSTTVSSFLNSFGEIGSAGQSKRFGRKHAADTNILDLINTLSEKVDNNDDFLSNSVSDINSTAAVYPSNGQTPNSVSPSNNKLSSSPNSGTNLWGSDLPDPSVVDSTGQVGMKGRLDSVRESNPTDPLGLGDLASLTVANEADSGLNGDVCDSNLPGNNYESSVLGGSVSSNAQVDSAANISSTYSTGRRPWVPRYTLRGHFDGIRSVAFHPTERAVYTAGEDGCVMLWNLLKTGPPGPVCPVDELSPVHVYCGHKGPVLCVTTPSPLLSSTMSTAVYSGGLDGTVRSWRLPSASNGLGLIDIYAPQELETVTGPVYANSSSSVWSIALHPSSPLLLAAHSDGCIDFWSTVENLENDSPISPVLSVHMDRLIKPLGANEPQFGRPTCLHFLVSRPDSLNASQCVVGTSTGWLALLDVQTGQLINQIPPAPPLTNPKRSLNALGSHQTLSLVIGAHEDRCIRFYDINRMSDRSSVTNSACVDAMVTHLNAVTSLAVDPHGLYLLTGSHDASIRVWDVESRSCIQEMTNHGFKYNESVHSVTLHPQLPLAASAGADAICKIYVTAT